MLQEFKTFIMKGNVLDLAVGVIIGGAFGKIVNSAVNDLIMPLVGLVMGKVDFSNLFINLSGDNHQTVAAAKAAGVPTLNYGIFLNTTIDFLIMALVIFYDHQGCQQGPQSRRTGSGASGTGVPFL